MNFVHIAGHIGKDPDTRFTADGHKVITLTVATNIRRGGNDETVWWRVTLWGDRWDKMLPYLTKGKPVMVGGDLTRKPEMYTDKNGVQQVSSLEISADYVKFSPFGKPDQQNGGQWQGQQQASGQRQSQGQQQGQGQGQQQSKWAEQPAIADESEEPLPF
jgi:single-strand DNA-binding protein